MKNTCHSVSQTPMCVPCSERDRGINREDKRDLQVPSAVGLNDIFFGPGLYLSRMTPFTSIH